MAAISKRYAFIKPDLKDVEVSLPSVALGSGVGSSFGVLKFGDLEVELNDSNVELLPEFFTAGSAVPEDEFTLGTGLSVTVGRIEGKADNGHCFGIKVGERCLLGSVPRTVPLDVLASWLADLQITPTASGLKVSPANAKWSDVRTASLIVAVRLRSGQTSLLDIRPAFRGVTPAKAGAKVQGGYLSRQPATDRPEHLVLNATEHVVYILTSSSEGLDELAELGSGVTVRSVA